MTWPSRGRLGNLPPEGYIAPLAIAGEGTIVFDGALADYGRLREPLRVTRAEGRAVDAEGDGADWLLETLDASGPAGRQIAERGIGNPAALLNGAVAKTRSDRHRAHCLRGRTHPGLARSVAGALSAVSTSPRQPRQR